MRIKAWFADWRFAVVGIVVGVPGLVSDIQTWAGWLAESGRYIAAALLGAHVTAVLFMDGRPYRTWWRRWRKRGRPVRSDAVTDIRTLTQAEYDALDRKDPKTLYLVTKDPPDSENAP